MSGKQPTIGPTRYRALDGSGDYCALITKVDDGWSERIYDPVSLWECSLTVWLPNNATPQLLTGVRFDPDATPETAKPGTCYQW